MIFLKRQKLSKNVVILHPAYWEQARGGAELQISYLVDSLLRRGHKVHYVFEDLGTEINNDLKIHLYPLKKSVIRSKRFGSRWIFYHKRINEILNELGPDVIYTRLFSSWTGLASNFALKSGAKHIWALASDIDITRLQRSTSIFKPFDIIEKKWVKHAFYNATSIIVQNNYQEEGLKRLYGRNGVFFRQSGFPCTDTIVKDKDTLNVLWIANFKPIKRPEIFINLLDFFNDTSNIRFTMIGRIQPMYRDLVNEAMGRYRNFDYLDELNSKSVSDCLSNADVLVNTSLHEGFSNTFVEAWMRKVVVISMNSNPDHILTEQNIGFVAPNVNDIADIINYLKNNPEKCDDMGERALKYATEFHSYEKNISKVLNLIEL